MLEPKLQAVATEAWAEVLTGAKVPADKLNDCYLYAATHRGDTSYPLSVTEIAAAWKEHGDNRPIWMASKK